MAAEVAFLLAALLIVGVSTQWIAWRFSLPPILLMLAGGFIAGPATGWLDPDAVMGDLLQPIVALGVAVILFEGGMTLRVRELRGVGRVLLLLVSVGALVTWAVAAAAAHLIGGVDLRVAALLGAILTVSGPTVVGPLLHHIRPQGAVASLLKWEGIVIDPIGALLAVFTFVAIRSSGPGEAFVAVLMSVVAAAIVGVFAGLAAAALLVVAIVRYWVPDHLQNAVALALVLAAYLVANTAQAEAGLVAVTIMGVAMANQPWAPLRPIIQFKETLRVLIIPALFILLTARITPQDIAFITPRHLVFLALLVFVARPLGVVLSTLRSRLHLRERLFLIGMMPRGIVAAAVASILALDLEALGVPDAEALVPLTFLVIVGTVLVYSVGGRPLALLLKVARDGRGGILLIGGGPFARAFGRALMDEEVEVQVVDTNPGNVTAANVAGLHARKMDILAEYADEAIGTERLDHVLALTPNDHTNQLCVLRYGEHVGRAETFRLAPSRSSAERSESPQALGRVLFDHEATWAELHRRVTAGQYVVRTRLSERFRYDDWKRHHGPDALPLALLREGRVEVIATDVRPEPLSGDVLLGLVPEVDPVDADDEQTAAGGLAKMAPVR